MSLVARLALPLVFSTYPAAVPCKDLATLVKSPQKGSYVVKGSFQRLSYGAAPGTVWWCDHCDTLWGPLSNSLSIFSSSLHRFTQHNVHCCSFEKATWYQGTIRVSQGDSYLDVTVMGPGEWVSTISLSFIRVLILPLLEVQHSAGDRGHLSQHGDPGSVDVQGYGDDALPLCVLPGRGDSTGARDNPALLWERICLPWWSSRPARRTPLDTGGVLHTKVTILIFIFSCCISSSSCHTTSCSCTSILYWCVLHSCPNPPLLLLPLFLLISSHHHFLFLFFCSKLT